MKPDNSLLKHLAIVVATYCVLGFGGGVLSVSYAQDGIVVGSIGLLCILLNAVNLCALWAVMGPFQYWKAATISLVFFL